MDPKWIMVSDLLSLARSRLGDRPDLERRLTEYVLTIGGERLPVSDYPWRNVVRYVLRQRRPAAYVYHIPPPAGRRPTHGEL